MALNFPSIIIVFVPTMHRGICFGILCANFTQSPPSPASDFFPKPDFGFFLPVSNVERLCWALFVELYTVLKF